MANSSHQKETRMKNCTIFTDNLSLTSLFTCGQYYFEISSITQDSIFLILHDLYIDITCTAFELDIGSSVEAYTAEKCSYRLINPELNLHCESSPKATTASILYIIYTYII